MWFGFFSECKFAKIEKILYITSSYNWNFQRKYLFRLLAFHEYGNSSPVCSIKRKAPGMSVSFAM
jgi:hypothetical protein